jgi:cob(I)alamin adenosyltransferase
MVRLSKIYTRTGDEGTTGLVGGERIRKSDLRLEAYGTVDEVNSVVGLLRTAASASSDSAVVEAAGTTLRMIQNDLFDIGSLLATAPGSKFDGMREFKEEHITYLEEAMDAYQDILKPLPSFVLPGGGMLNAHAHLARTVCRRCERLLWRLNDEKPVAPSLMKYMNRLSDYLFVFSRWVAVKNGEEEFLWESDIRRLDRKDDDV